MKRALFSLCLWLSLFGLTAFPAAAQCDAGLPCVLNDSAGMVLTGGDDVLEIPFGVRVANPVGSAIESGDGNDYITNNGAISSKVRGIDGGFGNDTLINNGTIREGWVGIWGFAGNDTITNTGTINALENGVVASEGGDYDTVINSGTIQAIRDTGVVGFGNLTNNGRIAGGSHGVAFGGTIINNGRVNATYGDALRGSDDSDDTITNNASGNIRGGTFGMNGLSGNDTLINYGSVRGGIQGWWGDDTVILYGGTVQGLISGGEDFDTLIFAQTVTASEYARISEALATADPNNGQITINRVTYRWAYFELIENQLTVQ